jgi:hypothetical protein
MSLEQDLLKALFAACVCCCFAARVFCSLNVVSLLQTMKAKREVAAHRDRDSDSAMSKLNSKRKVPADTDGDSDSQLPRSKREKTETKDDSKYDWYPEAMAFVGKVV